MIKEGLFRTYTDEINKSFKLILIGFKIMNLLSHKNVFRGLHFQKNLFSQ